MPNEMTSRQRMLTALNCQVPDHIPCSFMMFRGLQTHCSSYQEFLEKQLALGLDVCVEVPPRMPNQMNDYYNLHGLPVIFDPHVEINEWKEQILGEEYPILVKEYCTPEGVLRTEIRQTRDWRLGNHVPFLDDYIIPRARKFLVTTPADLKPLRYLLADSTREGVNAYKEISTPFIQFAHKNDLLLTGGWGVGADLVGWIAGLENMVYLLHDHPEMMTSLLEMIATWNRKRMEIALSVGLDLYIKRAWYENCDFWTPDNWRKFVQPILKKDVELAHQMGAKFGYILTSNAMRLIEPIIETNVDVLIGVDPRTYDLAVLARQVKGKLCLWGGVNGHLTVEKGTQVNIKEEVHQAIDLFKKMGGFILSPVDNIREYSPLIETNVNSLINAWKRIVG
jgi:uroporphyrinogen-III decarboxylase